MKRVVIICLFFICILSSTAHAWWNASWQNRIQLTFNNLTQSQNLTNFPVLVVLNGSRISYAATLDNGEDIRFVDADDSTALNYEIESWNESGTSYVWVNVPQIDASSAADFIYLYYNAAVADAQNADATWNAEYAGVYHLKQDPAVAGAGGMLDSSGNGYNGTDTGSMDANDLVAGKVGNCLDFDGTDDYILMTDSFDAFSTGTVEAWIKMTAGYTGFDCWFGTDEQWENAIQQGDTFRFWTSASVIDVSTAGIDAITNWHYLACSVTQSGNSLYVDGSKVTTSGTGSGTVRRFFSDYASGTDNYYIGMSGTTSECLRGQIDELRVSSSARTESWIAAQYLSMTDTFIVYGAAEDGDSGGSGYAPGYVQLSDVTLRGVEVR